MLHAKIIDLKKEKIEVNKAEEFISSSKFGASLIFKGTVRDNNENKKVTGITYDSHDAMVVKSFEEIYNSISKKRHLVHALKFKNKISNPIGFDSSVLTKFKRMKGDIGAKFMVKRLKNNTNFIKVLNKRVFKDLDLRKDFN